MESFRDVSSVWIERAPVTHEVKGSSPLRPAILKEREINMKKDREDYRFFRIWGDMNYRCNTPTCRAYKNYGARGIKVCDKWRHYQGFKEDMWESYLDHLEKFGEKQTTLDRINVDGNNSKENCKWSTYTEQRLNTRDKLYYIGERISDNYKVLFNNMTEFCKNNGLYRSGVGRCLYEGQESHKGWTFHIATKEERTILPVNNSIIEKT